MSRLREDTLPFGLSAVSGFSAAVATFYLTIFFKETRGFSGTELGLMYAAHATTGLLASLPGGLSNDRLTSRVLVAVSLAGQAAALLLLRQVTSVLASGAALFLFGIAGSLFRLSLDVQVLKTGVTQSAGRRISAYQATRFLGLLGAALATGYISELLGFEGALATAAVICLAMIAPALLLPPTPLQASPLRAYAAQWREPSVVVFGLWLLAFASHWGAEMTSYGPFLRTELGLSWKGIGWYMSAEYTGIIAAVVLIGPKVRRDTLRRATVAGLLLSGIGHVGMTLLPLVGSAALRALHGAGDGLMFVVMYVGIAELFDVERRGGHTGLVSMATMTGYLLGALVYGPLGEHCGMRWPLIASGLVTVALALPLICGKAGRALATASRNEAPDRDAAVV